MNLMDFDLKVEVDYFNFLMYFKYDFFIILVFLSREINIIFIIIFFNFFPI